LAVVKSKIIKKLADNNPNFLKKDLIKLTNIFFEEIKRALKFEKRVELRGFAVWSAKNQKQRMARNPRTGENIQIPKKKNIHFKMSKELFNKINNVE
tara:strand:- start:169 stop:459 length:291 start_codon:yes stop_codon:yes gene_type:complete